MERGRFLDSSDWFHVRYQFVWHSCSSGLAADPHATEPQRPAYSTFQRIDTKSMQDVMPPR